MKLIRFKNGEMVNRFVNEETNQVRYGVRYQDTALLFSEYGTNATSVDCSVIQFATEKAANEIVRRYADKDIPGQVVFMDFKETEMPESLFREKFNWKLGVEPGMSEDEARKAAYEANIQRLCVKAGNDKVGYVVANKDGERIVRFHVLDFAMKLQSVKLKADNASELREKYLEMAKETELITNSVKENKVVKKGDILKK